MKLIKIYSKICGPCKVLEKNLVESGVKYDSVDVASEEGEDLTETYGIRAVPTLLLVDDNGMLISKHVGILSVEGIKSFIYNHNEFYKEA